MRTKLTQTELEDLKSSIGSLEHSVEIIYATRKPRDVFGPEGILTRTLGEGFNSPKEFKPKYFDTKRNKMVETEFAETLEAIAEYDKNPGPNSRMDMFLEVGDTMFQRYVVERSHKNHPRSKFALKQFDVALSYLSSALEVRGYSMQTAERMAEVKYGVRAWLESKGYVSKDKVLERKLCMEIYHQEFGN
jgi:hypothetical protein